MTDKSLVDNPQVVPEEMHPETMADFVQRGWLYYSQKKFDQAISDFQEALTREGNSLDTHYALAMAYKYAGMEKEAVLEFSRVIDLSTALDDQVRASMLARLARGHIHQMKTGSWGDITEPWEK